jgi:hypothetical protein
MVNSSLVSILQGLQMNLHMELYSSTWDTNGIFSFQEKYNMIYTSKVVPRQFFSLLCVLRLICHLMHAEDTRDGMIFVAGYRYTTPGITYTQSQVYSQYVHPPEFQDFIFAFVA